MKWSTACIDWERRITSGQSLIPFGPLFPDEAASALRQFDELRIVDAAGSPTIGESCRPWVREFAGTIFGSYDHDSGRRLIRDFFLLISKKNSKSTIAAAIMLTALIRNWRKSAEFLIIAPTVEIANNSFYPARDMVRADDELRDLMHVQEHYRTITHRESGAYLRVVAADNESVGGKKAVGVLVDELWLFGKRPNADGMLIEATGGLASRPEGFAIYLSTQSDEPPAGVFRAKLQYARKVRDGEISDPLFLPLLYEFPRSMIEAKGYMLPENFGITNPNLGVSVDPAFIERGLTIAQETGQEAVVGVLAKHLNIEIGIALRSDRWAGADHWEACAVESLTLNELIARSEVITIGIDGGGLDDLLGLAVVGRCKETREWITWSKAWAHPSVLERRKSEAARFRDFERDGDLVIVSEIGQDVEQVADVVATIHESGLLDKIGADPVGIGAIVDAIVDAGVPSEKIVGISQGWKLAGAIKTTERKLAEMTMRHGGRPMMSWCIGNAKVELRGNAVVITKQAAGTAKIDPLAALFNAVSLMALNPSAAPKYQMMFV